MTKKTFIEYQKEYRQTKEGKASKRRYAQSIKCKIVKKRYDQSEKGKAAYKRYRSRHAGRIKAIRYVNHIVAAGKLPRPDTLQCSLGNHLANQYHHHKGYEPENMLIVIPVCRECHMKLHHPNYIGQAV